MENGPRSGCKEYEKVNERLDVQKAKYKYRNFLNDLSASKARNTTMGEVDPPVCAIIDVGRDEALDCFLKQRPKYECFRKQLKEIRKNQPTFTFNKELWQKAKC